MAVSDGKPVLEEHFKFDAFSLHRVWIPIVLCDVLGFFSGKHKTIFFDVLERAPSYTVSYSITICIVPVDSDFFWLSREDWSAGSVDVWDCIGIKKGEKLGF